MGQRKSSATSSISAEPKKPHLGAALQELEKKAEQPKIIHPAKVVAEGFRQIEAVLDQGYSFTDIARVFVKHGVKISVKDLKAHYEEQRVKRSQTEAKTISDSTLPTPTQLPQVDATTMPAPNPRPPQSNESATIQQQPAQVDTINAQAKFNEFSLYSRSLYQGNQP